MSFVDGTHGPYSTDVLVVARRLDLSLINVLRPFWYSADVSILGGGSSDGDLQHIRHSLTASFRLTLNFLVKRQNSKKFAKPWLLSPIPWKFKNKTMNQQTLLWKLIVTVDHNHLLVLWCMETLQNSMAINKKLLVHDRDKKG